MPINAGIRCCKKKLFSLLLRVNGLMLAFIINMGENTLLCVLLDCLINDTVFYVCQESELA